MHLEIEVENKKKKNRKDKVELKKKIERKMHSNNSKNISQPEWRSLKEEKKRQNQYNNFRYSD